MNHSTRTAKYSIAEDYLYGQNGKEQDLEKAYSYIAELASLGLGGRLCAMLADYYDFNDVSHEAFNFHLKAADYGYGPSQFKVAETLCASLTSISPRLDDVVKGIGYYTLALHNNNFKKTQDEIEQINQSIDLYANMFNGYDT